jgi:hypothetical protein
MGALPHRLLINALVFDFDLKEPTAGAGTIYPKNSESVHF